MNSRINFNGASIRQYSTTFLLLGSMSSYVYARPVQETYAVHSFDQALQQSMVAEFALAIVESVGVNTPVRAAGPAAAGTHEHLATYGETVVVGTASQPTITFPPAENATMPGTDAVAVITAGSSPNVAEPPDSAKVAGSAACADDIPKTANAATATLANTFFIT